MKQTEPNFKRPVMIFLSKDGQFVFARKTTKGYSRIIKDGSLPCASVNTLAEAEALQVTTCKQSRTEPGIYRYPLEPTLDGLILAGIELERSYQAMKSLPEDKQRVPEVKA